MNRFAEKLARALRNPEILLPAVRERMKRRSQKRAVLRQLQPLRAQLLARLSQLPPLQVPADDGQSPIVHMLTGREAVPDVAVVLISLFRSLKSSLPVIVHDDGSFRQKDRQLLESLVKGIRVIPRAEADSEVNAELRAGGHSRLLRLRRDLVFTLKLTDLVHYSQSRRVLYLDSDILFLRGAEHLANAIFADEADWQHRYNEDIGYHQTWSRTGVLAHMGVTLNPAPVNAGMMCIRFGPSIFSFFDEVLSLPARNQWTEQSLWYILLSREGASPLPPEYDVCYRHAWRGLSRKHCLATGNPGAPVVSQHYCGGMPFRRRFFAEALRILDEELTADVAPPVLPGGPADRPRSLGE